MGSVHSISNVSNTSSSQDFSSVHCVKKGESLWKIAGKEYGDPRAWVVIAEMNNRKIKDPDLILTGQTITLPSADEVAKVLGNRKTLNNLYSHYVGVNLNETRFAKVEATNFLKEDEVSRLVNEIRTRDSRYEVISPEYMMAMIKTESSFNRYAVSQDYCLGLTQFLPQTAKRMARRLGMADFKPSDLFKPEVSIRIAFEYLRVIYDRYGNNEITWAAAYFNGENSRFLSADMIEKDIPEKNPKTKHYVEKLMQNKKDYEQRLARLAENREEELKLAA
jgi:soluble lytic murein transglycosylase